MPRCHYAIYFSVNKADQNIRLQPSDVYGLNTDMPNEVLGMRKESQRQPDTLSNSDDSDVYEDMV